MKCLEKKSNFDPTLDKNDFFSQTSDLVSSILTGYIQLSVLQELIAHIHLQEHLKTFPIRL